MWSFMARVLKYVSQFCFPCLQLEFIVFISYSFVRIKSDLSYPITRSISFSVLPYASGDTLFN